MQFPTRQLPSSYGAFRKATPVIALAWVTPTYRCEGLPHNRMIVGDTFAATTSWLLFIGGNLRPQEAVNSGQPTHRSGAVLRSGRFSVSSHSVQVSPAALVPISSRLIQLRYRHSSLSE